MSHGLLVPLQNGGGGGIVGIVFLLIFLAVFVAVIAGTWKAFSKAGEPGWAAIIPIYNVYVMNFSQSINFVPSRRSV